MFTFQNNFEEALAENEIVVTGFSGTSMLPMLRSNRDRVVIQKVNRSLRCNDIPLYKRANGKLVLHRIVAVKPNGYIIRGDNLYRNEYNVTDNDIIGILKGFYRGDKLYDCSKSKGYKIYVVFIRLSYPLRYFLFGVIRPVLGKIKRLLTGKNKDK